MDRNKLINQIITQFENDNYLKCMEIIIRNNAEAKKFTISDLKKIDDMFETCRLKNYDIYAFFVKNNYYNKRYGALFFINNVPFYVLRDKKTERIFVPFYLRRKFKEKSPDCIDTHNETGSVQGWKLVNTFGKRNLKKLPDYLRYDIITKPENFEFYYNQDPTCRLNSHEDLASWD